MDVRQDSELDESDLEVKRSNWKDEMVNVTPR